MKKSFQITISGISTALTVIGIVLSFYLPVMKLTFFALSGITLMLPFVIDSTRGGILTFIASAILGLLFTNIFAILPFVFLFGTGTVVMYFVLRYLKNKWFLSLPIKIVFINIALFGLYKLIDLSQVINIFQKIGINPMYYIIALVATPIYLLYDYLLQNIFRYIKIRMNKIFKKHIAQDKE